jgi:hypothetical protein
MRFLLSRLPLRAWLLLPVAVVALMTGCATTDDAENVSERPWNAPKSWEHGMPSGMFEGR